MQPDWSIVISRSGERFNNLGDEDHPKYSPDLRAIREPETSIVDGKQPGKNYIFPMLNATRIIPSGFRDLNGLKYLTTHFTWKGVRIKRE